MNSVSARDIDRYRQDGFLRLPGLFEADELEPLAAALATDRSLGGESFDMRDTDGGSLDVLAWIEPSNSLLGLLPYARRTNHIAALLMGEPVYHWHSKLTMKPPRSNCRVEWHQDYGAWYYEGCLRPDLLTVGIAVEPMTRDSGCLQLIRGSHELGRLDHEYVESAQHRVCPARLERATQALETVAVELDRGDAVFFHSNTLHGSDSNRTSSFRTLLLSTYNAVANSPFGNQQRRQFRPRPLIADDVFARHDYPAVCAGHVFLKPQPEQMAGFGSQTEPS